MTPIAKLKAWERALRPRQLSGFTDAADRARALSYEFWLDHGFLRRVWSNFAEVAPGVFRANQPNARRLARWKSRGIATVLCLRGDQGTAPVVLEREACAALGLGFHVAPLTAREAPSRQHLLNLIALFSRLKRPFVMHCKSGADRASLASAVWLLTQEGASVAEARRMLSPRFVHLKWTRTGILDHILDAYEARLADAPIPFEDWVATEYNAAALQAEFNAKRGRR